MTDAAASPDRSPFRRPARQGLTESGASAPGFPWPQLAFCVACLAMTGWTWMRDGERPSPRRHGGHGGRREHSVAVLSAGRVSARRWSDASRRVLRDSVVRFAAAGLAVGAMGCFIFALYLRRWLVARKAAFTTEPQRAQRTT